MGLFDAIKNVGSAAVKTAVLPVSVAADIATLGGLSVDRDESFTASNLKGVGRKLSEAYDDVVED